MISIDVDKIFMKLAHECHLDPLTIKYCLSRFGNEGIKFFTVTLPKLSKAVLRSLELGYFERPTCFAWKGRSLRYFRSLLNAIFDHRSGLVLPSVCPKALKQLRTLCEYFYKLALSFEESELEQAEIKFVENDKSLASCPFDPNFVEQLRKDAETYYSFVRQHAHEVFSYARPRSGPGTFAGIGQLQDPYYIFREKDYMPSKAYRGFEGYFKPYPSAPVRVKTSEDTSLVSEVLFVPKDSRGPRTIVREPYRALMGQMGFHDWITDALEHATSGRVNFRDQLTNRELARLASRSKEFSTLDLKDASDRVDKNIISHIFRNSPAIRFFVNRRTTHSKLPSGRIVRLNKLSGMGSGLTFPLMSFLIYLAVVREITDTKAGSYAKVMRTVYVYGDDLIVKTKDVDCAIRALAKVKLAVNSEKTFIHSHFRESCGGDFYDGQDVAPVRLKLSNSEPVVSGSLLKLKGSFALLQLEKHCRELVQNEMCSLAELYYAAIEQRYGSLPTVAGESPVIGRYSTKEVFYPAGEFGQYPTVRVILPQAKSKKTVQCAYRYISKFLSRYSEPDEYGIDILPVGSAFGEVTVPRSIVYRRTRVSAFRLMG